ncbi:MAG: hydrogenase maturation nickel metallochaperone HypA [Chloroflexota bacterium]|jgi:hydrogenase nickel incorporation protein HypA/HybF
MHELSFAQSILEISLNHAQMSKAKRVLDLYMVIGQLSSIVDDSIQFYWDIISQDTVCEGAQLHFERIPGTLECIDCHRIYTIEELSPCPSCGSIRVQIIEGKEFRLDSIEIEA